MSRRTPARVPLAIATLAIAAAPAAQACTTCNPELQDAIAEHFASIMLLVSVPVALVFLSAWLVPLMLMREPEQARERRLIASGLLIGAGFGGFLDGIVFHQVMQWHQMISARVPPDTLLLERVNMFWDGVFHLGMWCVSIAGIAILVHTGREAPIRIGRDVTAAMVIGWGSINVFDGVLDHLVFRLHNLREADHQMMSNVVFLIVGLAITAAGVVMMRRARGEGKAGR